MITAVYAIGLLSGVHCVGMCGGIVSSLSLSMAKESTIRQKTLILLYYNTGRIGSYVLAGALLGSAGGLLAEYSTLSITISRFLAGLMIIAMGLYLTGWWRGLAYLERFANTILWRHLQGFSKHFIPVKWPHQAIMLGALWGWLPCGLVYSTLALAAVSGGWRQAALCMAAFGLGTLPSLMIAGLFSTRIRSLVAKPEFRISAALLVTMFGLWTLAAPWVTAWYPGHEIHQGHSSLYGDSAARQTSSHNLKYKSSDT